LSDLEATMATERAQHEEQARTLAEAHARALAEAQALRNALEIELNEAKTQRQSAIDAAYHHAERYAQIELEVEAQRRACEEAEARARAEQDRREEAALALLEVKKVVRLWSNA
jgi:hypothetical protein